jgi:hypothetical protein
MSARYVSSLGMIFLHATYSGVVLHPRRVRMRHPPSYTVKIAKTMGMLRWIVLILWMSFESTVFGPDILYYTTLLLDHVHFAFRPCYTYRLYPYPYLVIVRGTSMTWWGRLGAGPEMTSMMHLMALKSPHVI